MIRKLKNELKIAGSSLFLISIAFAAALIFLAATAGELLDLGSMGFEVIFPFFAAIAVGEWGKTRADDNYDVIASQSRSLFKWVLSRYFAIWGTISLVAVAAMVAVFLLRREMTLGELVLVYLPTSFFLSSLSAYIGLRCSQEHIAALVCGIIWLAMLLLRSLLRIPGLEYFYLFIRFAGDINGVWLVNKAILSIAGSALWCAIYMTCKNRLNT